LNNINKIQEKWSHDPYTIMCPTPPHRDFVKIAELLTAYANNAIFGTIQAQVTKHKISHNNNSI